VRIARILYAIIKVFAITGVVAGDTRKRGVRKHGAAPGSAARRPEAWGGARGRGVREHGAAQGRALLAVIFLDA
jgi:hypothetical protein